MENFKLGVVQYQNDTVSIIKKVFRSLCILTDLGPYTGNDSPIRLVLLIGSDGKKILERRVEKYWGNYGDIGENSAPYWETIRRKPSETDLEDARRTIINAQNGAYGKIDVGMQVFLRKILLQILT